MKYISSSVLILSTIPVLNAVSISSRAESGATVDLSKSLGPTQQLASGWIYGFPDNGIEADNSIPGHFITDLKFGAGRAGGAQIPAKGWVGGYDAYVSRLNSTISNYRTTRKYGGDFILLVHDLWGADGSGISAYPGDDGDWTETDKFLQQLADDIKASNLLDGLILDIWNEPDLSLFWDRSWDQFLEYYVHAHNFFRRNLPNTLLSGPAMAVSATLDNDKWKQWLSTVAEKGTVPDIYSWHQIDISWSRQPDTSIPDFNIMKGNHNLPDRPIDITEYANKAEQTPGCSVYYIAQLERHNLRGLRAHWGSRNGLHDDISNLIFKDAGGVYKPNGEWQLYKYYADMDGDRVATTASDDLNFDVFAIKTSTGAKIVAGTRNIKTSYEIQVSGLTSLGLPSAGKVTVQTYRFDWPGESVEVTGPVDMEVGTIEYKSGSMVLTVSPSTSATAYAFEISIA